MPATRVLPLLLLAMALFGAGGCTRTHYRLQANREVKCLVGEKSNDPRWAFPRFPVRMDPRARYFDPTNPDHPPLPLDDPASHEFMHCVDGMRGYPCWHADGDRAELENPRWRELLATCDEVSRDGRVKLAIPTAVQLGILHSTDYRAQVEDIYLSALDVSTERFRFDVQFFGNTTTTFTHRGEISQPLGAFDPNFIGETNTLRVDNELSASKRFATGAELLVNFANSFVWQFAGDDRNVAGSLLSFNLVQPLLRAGGRAVALEQLTIVERTLLANLRTFQRYRQGFYTNIVLGDGGVQGPQRRGGFLGGTGLTGFTGTGSGGFGEVGQATGFGRITGGTTGTGAAGGGTAGFAGGGAGTVGGLLGLLQQMQQIRNTQDNLRAQQRALGLLDANLAAGLIDGVQVDQFRQNIETERANLLASEVGLANSLDQFLVVGLGLPPELPITLDDAMLEPFRLVEPRTSQVREQIADFIDLIGEMPAEPALADLQKAFAAFTALRGRARQQFTGARRDLDAMRAALPKRAAQLATASADALRTDLARLEEVLKELRERDAAIDARAEAIEAALNESTRAASTDQLVDQAKLLSDLVQELALLQARARLESISVEPTELDSERALEIARANRLDWMNNRAALVDTWRLITFNANALKAGLDITFSGDLGTVGNNVVAFNGRNGNLRAGVRFDAPLTRLIERNNYVQSLISYQQDRRKLIQYQDQVNMGLRRLLRQLDQLTQNLEIQRRAVIIALRRVDQTQEELNEPPPPVAPGLPVQQLGPTSATNLLTALSDLRNTQNNFMSVWFNHYALRIQLTRELGIMELDEHGLWIDRPLSEVLALPEDACPMPPDVSDELIIQASVALPEGKSDRPWQAMPEPQRLELPKGEQSPGELTAAQLDYRLEERNR